MQAEAKPGVPVPPLPVAQELIELSTLLAQEKDLPSLLGRVLTTARRLTHAEGGCIYTLDDTKRVLNPTVLQNATTEAPLRHLPPVPLAIDGKVNLSNVCGYCAISGQPVNIADVYATSTFDFRDIQRFDQLIRDRTRSLFAVSLRNPDGQTVGIMQLTNFRDAHTGAWCALPSSAGELVNAFAAFAAVVLTKANLIDANRRLIEALAAANERLTVENHRLRPRTAVRLDDEIVGQSAAIEEVMQLIDTVAGSDVTVLVQGETGSGKERVARAVHDRSARAKGPFVAQNCSAFPEALLESELFGHIKGAFSGAIADKRGLLVAANDGTVFLDEIGDMPLALQAKLLRVLQEREVRPVGAVRSVPINARVIAATHRDLKQMIREGSFREDLYFRLAVFPIVVPPLRARTVDIPLFIEYFIDDLSSAHGKRIAGVSPAAFEALTTYDYPGNVRELRNILERAFLLCDTDCHIQLNHLPYDVIEGVMEGADDALAHGGEATVGGLKAMVELRESQIIAQTLREHGWNQTRSAQVLRLSRRALVQKITKYNLRRNDYSRNV